MKVAEDETKEKQDAVDAWQEAYNEMEVKLKDQESEAARQNRRAEEAEAAARTSSSECAVAKEEARAAASAAEEVDRERTQLVDMNKDLSEQVGDFLVRWEECATQPPFLDLAQVTEGLCTIRRLQASEIELRARTTRLEKELENEREGAQVELHNHWEAEDDVLSLQAALRDAESAMAAAASDAASAREARDNAENELRAARQEMGSKDGTILKLVRNCQENSAAVARACAQAEEAERKARELRQALSDSSGREKEARDALSSLSSRAAEMESFLDQYMAENKDLREKAKALEDEKEHVEKR